MAQFTVPTENEFYAQTTDPTEPGDMVQYEAAAAVEYDDADTIADWTASQNMFTFSSGNICPTIGSVITGATTGRTAVVVGVRQLTGTWGSNDVTGSVFYKSKSAATAFQVGENISIVSPSISTNAMTVTLDTGNATDPTITLDQTNMVEGLGCVKTVFSGSHTVRCVTCYKSAGVDFTGQQTILTHAKSSTTNEYTFGFGETCINDNAWAYTCTGGDWETISKGMSTIADASKDGVIMVALYDAGGTFSGGSVTIDRVYTPALGVNKVKLNLLGDVVQMYPGRGSPVRPFKYPMFGAGTTDLTVSSDTTLGDSTIQIKVLEYDNITIEDGHYLRGHANDVGLVILVKDTLTLGAGSFISMNNRGATGGAAANGGGAGAFGGGGGGGAGGTDAGAGAGGGGQPGEDASGSTAGDGGGQLGNNQARSLPGVGYGRGGDGGGVAAVGDAGVRTTWIQNLYSLIPFSPEVAFQLLGGGGGGGGSATGGAGGGGGGIIWIEAKTIVWGTAAYISSDGTAGSQGASNKGAGGGGAGGCVVCIYESDTGSQSITVSHGDGGAANGTGKAGGSGSNGIGQYIKLEAETLEQSVT